MRNPNFDFTAVKDEPVFTFQKADWIKSTSLSYLFPIDHHMRVTNVMIDIYGQRWYQIFDTTAKRGFADYQSILASEIEQHSVLVDRPDAQFHPYILQRTELCRNVPYSIKDRQDCESIQRWIQSGDEKYRYSPQVWTVILTVAGSFAYAVYQTYKPKPRRRTQNARVSKPRRR